MRHIVARHARRRAARSLIAAAALWSAVAACARSSAGRPGDVSLDFWAFGREGEVVSQLVPEFERRNPGIHVRVQQIPWTAAHEKLLTAFVGDRMPDVAQLGNTWVPELVALGALEPLGSRVAASATLTPAGYFPGVWATNVVAGEPYGVPWYVDTRVMFYRTDLLARAGYATPPTSWAAWTDAMRKVKQRGGPSDFAILFPLDEWAQPTIFGIQAGSTILDSAGRYGAFERPEFRRGFDFYVGLVREGLAPAFSNTQVSNVFQEFARGRFAMYVTGPWNIGEFSRHMPPEMKGRWATAPLPGPDGPASGLSLAGGSSVVLFRASPHKDAAWKLLEFLAEPAQQVKFYELTGDLPARLDAWRSPVLADNEYARAFFTQLGRVRPVPKVPEWEQIATRIAQASEAAARGRQTSDEALAALDGDVANMLEKRRWLLARGVVR